MTFEELKDIPDWAKCLGTAVLGAGGAQLLKVWLENRRLEKKEYRDTLLGRIKELEGVIATMQVTMTELSVKLAVVIEENRELKEERDAHAKTHRRNGGNDAKRPESLR